MHRAFGAHASPLALSSAAVGPSGWERSNEINDPCASLDVTNKLSCLLLLKQKGRSGVKKKKNEDAAEISLHQHTHVEGLMPGVQAYAE